MREKVKFANSLLPRHHSIPRSQDPLPCKEIPAMHRLHGLILLGAHRLFPDPSGAATWSRAPPAQARLDTLQKAIQKRSLCICLSIITDQLEHHHPWEVSGRVMKSLAFLSSKFSAQTHPSISCDVPTVEPSPRCSDTPSTAPHEELTGRGVRHPAQTAHR